MNTILALVMTIGGAAAATPKSGAPAETGWSIREEVRLPDGRVGWQVTEIGFGKIRRTTSQSPEVVIVDPSAAIPVVRLFPDQKAWSGIQRELFDAGDMPGPFLEGVGLSGTDTLDAPAKPFRPTGEVAKIGAWPARELASVAKAPGNMETRLWVADRPAGLPNHALLSVVERVYVRKGNRWEAYFRGMKDLGGFPVRTVYRYATSDRTAEVVATVTSIERVPLDESAFRVPIDFERVSETRIPDANPKGKP